MGRIPPIAASGFPRDDFDRPLGWEGVEAQWMVSFLH